MARAGGEVKKRKAAAHLAAAASGRTTRRSGAVRGGGGGGGGRGEGVRATNGLPRLSRKLFRRRAGRRRRPPGEGL